MGAILLIGDVQVKVRSPDVTHLTPNPSATDAGWRRPIPLAVSQSA